MKLRHPLLLTLALAASALSVSAQTMKPGLWEMKSKMSTSSGEMEKAMALAQKEMAKMPADQRKMMEDMLAQQGMKMDVGTGATSLKLCIHRRWWRATRWPCKTVTASKPCCPAWATP